MSILDRFKKQEETLGKGSVAKKVVDADKKEEKKPAKEKKASSDKKAAAPKKEKKATVMISKKATETLLGPIVSEKSAHLADTGVLVFKVASDSNKVSVRNAIRELYKVTPLKVNILTVRGKAVRFGRQIGKTNAYKKAIVTLPEGTHIDIFDGV